MKFSSFFLAILNCLIFSAIIFAFDDAATRVEAGREFLSPARLDRWERYFSDGLSKMGKISILWQGETTVESWFDGEHMLIKTYYDDETSIVMRNARYFAEISLRGGDYEITSIDPPGVDPAIFQIDTVPFATCSSVNLSREIIPRHIQDEKLAVSDYRFENGKHYVELEFTEDADQGKLEVVFYEDSGSMLPNEATHAKGSEEERHFVNSNFIEVEGYSIPTDLSEPNRNDKSTVLLHPEERLDSKMCYLLYYGLPEPDEMDVTDFGRGSSSYKLTIAGVLIAVVVAFGVSRRFFKTSE